jgi:hypothetical protein
MTITRKLSRSEVIDCGLIRGGSESILAKVPDVAGVYAWYRRIVPPDPENASGRQYAEFIAAEIRQPHMLSRSASLASVFKMQLSSRRRLSSAKLEPLEHLCENLSFRRLLYELLTSESLLFQQPLYIGKANSLRQRISDHLMGRSPLRQRLARAGVNIEQSVLSYIEVNELPQDTNLMLEEILSRLFYPPFVERMG